MSTMYRCFPPLPWNKLWSSLPPGLCEEITPQTARDYRCLTNGCGYLWASTGDDGDTGFERFGIQRGLQEMIMSIENHFGIELVSEHDPRFREGMEDEDEEEPLCP